MPLLGPDPNLDNMARNYHDPTQAPSIAAPLKHATFTVPSTFVSIAPRGKASWLEIQVVPDTCMSFAVALSIDDYRRLGSPQIAGPADVATVFGLSEAVYVRIDLDVAGVILYGVQAVLLEGIETSMIGQGVLNYFRLTLELGNVTLEPQAEALDALSAALDRQAKPRSLRSLLPSAKAKLKRNGVKRA